MFLIFVWISWPKRRRNLLRSAAHVANGSLPCFMSFYDFPVEDIDLFFLFRWQESHFLVWENVFFPSLCRASNSGIIFFFSFHSENVRFLRGFRSQIEIVWSYLLFYYAAEVREFYSLSSVGLSPQEYVKDVCRIPPSERQRVTIATIQVQL